MGIFEKRQRVQEHLVSLAQGSKLSSIPYADRAATAALALMGGLLDVREVPQKLAAEIALLLIKEAPWRERDEAADVGSSVHDWAERIALGAAEFSDVPTTLQNHVKNFQQFVVDFGVVFEATEFTVYNRRYGYAGTGDFLARFSAYPELGLILGDYKTSKSGIWADIAIQLSAIAHGEFIGLPDDTEIPVPKIDSYVGVNITSTGYKVIPVNIANGFDTFLHAKSISEWVNVHSKSALGQPLEVRK